MKRLGRRGRPTVEEPTEVGGPPVEVVDPDVHLQARWTGGPALRTRVVHGVLVAALVTGPAALVLVVGQAASATSPLAAPVAETAPQDGGEQAAVGEFAQQLVLLWLQTARGDEAVLADLVDTAGLQLAETPMTGSDPQTAQLVSTGSGQWAVTVAVTVTDVTVVPVRRYFQVPVRYTVDTGALVAVTLPAPVAGPPAAVSPQLGYRYMASSSDPVTLAAGEFLGSLLTGAGDVTRFVSPGTQISAVTPPPFTGVQVREVTTDVDLRGAGATAAHEPVRALVTALATVTAEQAVTVQYPLTLTTREGRWEVSSLDAAPLPAEESSSPLQPTPTGPRAPSPTTPGGPSTAPPSSAPVSPTS